MARGDASGTATNGRRDHSTRPVQTAPRKTTTYHARWQPARHAPRQPARRRRGDVHDTATISRRDNSTPSISCDPAGARLRTKLTLIKQYNPAQQIQLPNIPCIMFNIKISLHSHEILSSKPMPDASASFCIPFRIFSKAITLMFSKQSKSPNRADGQPASNIQLKLHPHQAIKEEQLLTLSLVQNPCSFSCDEKHQLRKDKNQNISPWLNSARGTLQFDLFGDYLDRQTDGRTLQVEKVR